jgi:glycosyltransferase involved in cell wall biosynthesis
MRVGQNPAKSIDQVTLPARVTVAVVSYIPFLSGYYAESLEILKACLGSIWDSTPAPYDLMVFDNGSCPEVKEYLAAMQSQGRIQYLLLSEKNIGKGGAWNFIFEAAPGEVIAYTDSDVSFSPGWFEDTLAILEAYPKVGMVTARPMRSPEQYYSSTLEWAQSNPGATVDIETFIDWETYRQHIVSLGTSEEQAREWYDTRKDYRLTYQGTQALVGAAHFQFTSYKSALQEFLPFRMDRPMGQVRSLDEQMNTAGYLRLCTCRPYVRHLGNQMEGTHSRTRDTSAGTRSQGWAELPLVKRFLLKIYDAIFRLYFH